MSHERSVTEVGSSCQTLTFFVHEQTPTHYPSSWFTSSPELIRFVWEEIFVRHILPDELSWWFCKFVHKHKSWSHVRGRARSRSQPPPLPFSLLLMFLHPDGRHWLTVFIVCSARTDWLNPAKRQHNVCFCCLPGEVPLCPQTSAPATVTETEFREDTSLFLHGAVLHLPVAAHWKLVRNLEWVIKLFIHEFSFFFLPLFSSERSMSKQVNSAFCSFLVRIRVWVCWIGKKGVELRW